ncbi:MAG: EamA family transporter [Lachnospiraceae bacterium]|jgi:small multidrug resistance pump|nr:EamA family transporter [Lachnospiraceae bacterium]MDD3615567.1 EamA family transporter [Lachnospiraceae bacterium]
MRIEIYYIILALGTLIASFSQVLLKKGAMKQYPSIIREYLNPHVIIGYGMMVISTMCTIIAYTKVAYKNGPVVESTGFIYVMVLSFIFFKEKITKRKLLGNFLILVGIIVFYM